MEKQLHSETSRGMSGLSMWALAFGCIIGWGAFVMPGTTFLPKAGPIGTLIGVVIAAAMVLTVCANYSYLLRRYPDEHGSYAYTRKILGEDHAFLAVWSLALAYLSLLWANATAFVLIGRYLFGQVFQWGLHYCVAGYDVYLGEVCVTLLILALFGLVACYAEKLAALLRTGLAALLFLSVALLFACVLAAGGGAEMASPAFAAAPRRGIQVLNIVTLAPWLFVGFEAPAHTMSGQGASARRFFFGTGAAIVSGMLTYIFLTLVGAAATPEGYENWVDYITGLGEMGDIKTLPVFYSAEKALGVWGVRLAALAAFSALSTSLLGFYHAAAGVLQTMADGGLLPGGLAETRGGVPRKATLAILLISLPIPFLGRTSVGWNADVSTLSVSIVYAYVSACAYLTARKEKNALVRAIGLLGAAFSALLFSLLLIPNIFSENALASESYFMLAGWSMVGLLYYWIMLRRDKESRFGKSMAMWLLLLFLLFFSAIVWVRLYLQEKLRSLSGESLAEAGNTITGTSVMLMLVTVAALLILLNVFSVMLRRQRELNLKIMQSEDRSRAKTVFLSNMSHDIRTPMNAIIGFTNLALRDCEDTGKVREYLGKIRLSSEHLLSLINDVLEMSRIESGKVELDETVVNLPELLHELHTIIIGQAKSKRQELTMDTVNISDEYVYCDRLRMKQVLLNLLSNAVKYTPEGGRVAVRLTQNGRTPEGFADYEVHVRDNGIGMTPEFVERIFEAFERENTATVSGIQGTGLGMAITKRIVDMMGGTIEVKSAPGAGSEFTVRVSFRVSQNGQGGARVTELEGLHALVVDNDLDICDSTTRLLSEMGLRAEWTASGKEAVFRTRQAHERGDDFGVFLLDWKMPDLNGIEAARQIRSVIGSSTAPILLTTGYDWPLVRNEALAAGITGFCSKPLFRSELESALIRALAGTEGGTAQGETVPEIVSFAGKRALLVDDIEISREIARAVLEMSDFEVEEACDGAEAVEKVRTSAQGYYDVVIMDIQMPVMNGYEATRAIRALGDAALASVPIVAMTANAFEEDRQAAVTAGMNGYVAKPIDTEELMKTLSEIIGRRAVTGL